MHRIRAFIYKYSVALFVRYLSLMTLREVHVYTCTFDLLQQLLNRMLDFNWQQLGEDTQRQEGRAISSKFIQITFCVNCFQWKGAKGLRVENTREKYTIYGVIKCNEMLLFFLN